MILHLVARSQKPRIVERYIDALRSLEGAYSLVALTNKKLIGARDPLGIRPLILGILNGAYILCSETCALDIIGARFVREVENGESRGHHGIGHRVAEAIPAHGAPACIFEYVYFSRPDSNLGGRSVMKCASRWAAAGVRIAYGSRCRHPVPRFGVPAALGFAQEAGIPFELGIIRNHYVGRTFIDPTQTSGPWASSSSTMPIARSDLGPADRAPRRFDRAWHDLGQDRAHDVRGGGTRSPHCGSQARQSGSPISTASTRRSRSPLLAATHSVDEMRDHIGVTSLAFLSVDGL